MREVKEGETRGMVWERSKRLRFQVSRFGSTHQTTYHRISTRRGQWEIRVFFLECTEGNLEFEVKWGKGPSSGDRDAILEAVLTHRAALLLEWGNKVCPSK